MEPSARQDEKSKEPGFPLIGSEPPRRVERQYWVREEAQGRIEKVEQKE